MTGGGPARLFIAVWPPAGVVDRIAALPRPPVVGLRWTGADQWHVTLRFLGWVKEVEAAFDAFRGVSGRQTTAVAGPAVGRFGQRVLHVPVDGLDALAAAATEATAAVGRPPERRPFSGHITLARSRDPKGVDLRPLAGTPFEAAWPVRELTLVRSQPHPKGSRYEVVERVALAS